MPNTKYPKLNIHSHSLTHTPTMTTTPRRCIPKCEIVNETNKAPSTDFLIEQTGEFEQSNSKIIRQKIGSFVSDGESCVLNDHVNCEYMYFVYILKLKSRWEKCDQ